MKEASFSRTVKEVHFGAWVLDPKRQTICDGEVERELEPLLFKILCYLILNNDEIITRQDLVDDVWCQKYVDDNAINRAMSELRKVLKSEKQRGLVVKTHYRKGYSFFLDVNVVYMDDQTESINRLTPSADKQASADSKATEKRTKPFYLLAAAIILLVSFGTTVYLSQGKASPEITKESATFKESLLSWAPGQYDYVKVSPSKSLVAYSFLPSNSSNETMVVKSIESGTEKKLAIEGSRLFPIGWSSDSLKVIYRQESENGDCQVWQIASDFESNNKLLFDCDSRIKHAAALPNQQFIYSKMDYRGRENLSVLTNRNLTTGDEFQLTSPNLNSYGDNFLLYVPTLEAVFFERVLYDSVELYMTDPEGSKLVKLYTGSNRIDSLSYDSTKNSLLWFKNSTNELYELSLKQKELVKITKLTATDTMYASYKAISPSKLITTSYPYSHDIYGLDPNTHELTKLVDEGTINYGGVAAGEEVYFLSLQEDKRVIRKKELKADIVTRVGIPSKDIVTLDYNAQNQIILVRLKDKIQLYADDLSLLSTIEVKGTVISAKFLSESEVGYITVDDDRLGNRVNIYSINNGKSRTLPIANVLDMLKLADDRLAFLSSHDTLIYFDTHKGTQLTEIELPKDNTYQKFTMKDYTYQLFTVKEGEVVYSDGRRIFNVNLDEGKLIEFYQLDPGFITSNLSYSKESNMLILSVIYRQDNHLLMLNK